jgi:hypothetical protein
LWQAQAISDAYRNDGLSLVETLEFEEIHFLDVQRLAIALDQNDDAEPYGSFRRRDNDYEQDKNLALHFAESLAESDKGEIDGVEHELDGHENGDDVAFEDEGDGAESEEDGA